MTPQHVILIVMAMIVGGCDAKEPPLQLPIKPVVEMPAPAADAIQPDPDHPMYWRYRGKPVLLLGGSIEDNLFQIANLEQHLDVLVSVGGNYVRNTMSPRDEGNVQPHFQDPDASGGGKYDLTRWSDEYWRRFDHFLEATAARGIIVQIELWDRFDLANEPWIRSSFNPANTTTYTTEQTGLEHRYDSHPGKLNHPFFRTVPALDNNTALLAHQQRFVDRMLESSLKYGHVLYCMDNETHVKAAWGEYWATYIQQKAAAAGKHVYCTEMWDPWSLDHEMHQRTSGRPDLYRFIEVSQNNHMPGDAHYQLLLKHRQRIVDSGDPRPLTSVKVYGADSGRFESDDEGLGRFWRNIFGGASAVRFHRPPSGLGLGDKAQAHLRSARMFTDAFDIFATQPTWDVFTRDRKAGEAYCLAQPGRTYAVFFPNGGEVTLKVEKPDALSQTSTSSVEAWSVRWLDISRSEWRDEQRIDADTKLKLTAPGSGYWAVLVTAAPQQ